MGFLNKEEVFDQTSIDFTDVVLIKTYFANEIDKIYLMNNWLQF